VLLIAVLVNMLILCPLWYLPHYCLSQVLYVLDNVDSNRAAISWAIIMVLSRIANMILLIQQANL